MKTRLLLTPLLGLLVLLASCSPSGSGSGPGDNGAPSELRLAQISLAVEIGTQIAVSKSLQSKPELSIAFRLASEVIKISVSEEEFDPTAIQAALSAKVGTGEWAPLVNAGLTLALATYKDFYDRNWQGAIAGNLSYSRVLEALARGVDAGIANSEAGGVLSTGRGGTNPMDKYRDNPDLLKL